MFIFCNLSVLTLMLTLQGQVQTGEIIGGQKAKPRSRPYMALLEIETHGNSKTWCGGFLLSEEFVLTAAHCQEKSYKVRLGILNINDKAQILTVEKEFPHAKYNENGFKNDIMLLKLASKANISSGVKPISLAEEGDSGVPKACSVSGWGQTKRTDEHMSPTLMEVDVTLINSEDCVKDKVYCSEGEKGPGLGDSGGPLVCEDGKAYGVVSASRKEKSGSFLYQYTSIPQNREWIDCIMKHEKGYLAKC